MFTHKKNYIYIKTFILVITRLISVHITRIIRLNKSLLLPIVSNNFTQTLSGIFVIYNWHTCKKIYNYNLFNIYNEHRKTRWLPLISFKSILWRCVATEMLIIRFTYFLWGCCNNLLVIVWEWKRYVVSSYVKSYCTRK